MKLFGASGVVIQAEFCRDVGRMCLDTCRCVVNGFSDVGQVGMVWGACDDN